MPTVAGIGTFGAEKGSKYLGKILSPESLRQIKLDGVTNRETGPYFLGKVITVEDVYYNIKYIPAEAYLPYLPWSSDPRARECHCRFKDKVP